MPGREKDKAKTIFKEALSKSPGEDRETCIEQACREDRDLLKRVRELFARCDQPTVAIDGTTTSAAAGKENTDLARFFDEGPGSVIDGYELVRTIGEGAFGIVYEARQEKPVKRTVALKVIKPGMDSREIIERFKAERQAVALMDHPNIAHVYDAGSTETGRPYFVMELVNGVRITEYCDERKLTTRQRLKLMAVVCGAVQHAHQKGIIHRDLKPSNILVSDDEGSPIPKIIDFGVAKAIESDLAGDSLMTTAGQLIGTPDYMSPEQVGLSSSDIDTRSDIYSLGVLLYELLTGRIPVDADRWRSIGYLELHRILLNEEPPSPLSRIRELEQETAGSLAECRQTTIARLIRTIRGDLEWIVLRALERDRDRRYQTANALAMDLNRFMANEPVLASPPSAAYRVRKFARRNKGALAATAALVAMLIVGLIASLSQAVRAERAKHRAEAVAGFLVDIFRSPDPEQDGRTITGAEMLDRSLDKLREGFGDDPATKANLLVALGQTYEGLGILKKEVEVKELLLELNSGRFGEESVELIDTLDSLADAYRRFDLQEDWLAIQRRLRSLKEKKLGIAHPDVLRVDLTIAEVLAKEQRHQEVVTLLEPDLAISEEHLGLEDEITLELMKTLAFSLFRAERSEDGRELLARIAGVMEENATGAGTAIPDLIELAKVYEGAGRLDEAIATRKRILGAIRDRIGIDNLDTVAELKILAKNQVRNEDMTGAIASHRLRYEIFGRIAGEDHETTLDALEDLAEAHRHSGDQSRYWELIDEKKAAEERAEESDGEKEGGGIRLVNLQIVEAQEKLKETESRLESRHPETLRAMATLAEAYNRAQVSSGIPVKDCRELLEIRRELMNRQENVLGPDHPETLRNMDALADSLKKADQLEESIRIRERIVGGVRAAYGEEHLKTLVAMIELAESFIDHDDFERARELVEPRYSKMRANESLSIEKQFEAMDSLADAYEGLDRVDDSISLRKESIRRHWKFEPVSRIDRMHENLNADLNLLKLKYLYIENDRIQEWHQLAELNVKLAEEARGELHEDTFKALQNLAQAYKQDDQPAKAITIWTDIHQRRSSTDSPDPKMLAETIEKIADLYRGSGDLDMALEWYRKILAWPHSGKEPEDAVKDRALIGAASILRETRRHEEEIRLFGDFAKQSAEFSGAESLATLRALSRQASALAASGKIEEAERIHQRLVARSTERFGEEHVNTLRLKADYGLMQLFLGSMESATEELEELSAKIQEKAGRDDRDVVMLAGKIAETYQAMGEHGMAIIRQSEFAEGSASTLGGSHPVTLRAKANLRKMLEEWEPEATPESDSGKRIEKQPAVFSEIAEPGEFRLFRDRAGRTVRGRVLKVMGDEVEIERESGESRMLPIRTFSNSDQDFIRSQAAAGAVSTKTGERVGAASVVGPEGPPSAGELSISGLEKLQELVALTGKIEQLRESERLPELISALEEWVALFEEIEREPISRLGDFESLKEIKTGMVQILEAVKQKEASSAPFEK